MCYAQSDGITPLLAGGSVYGTCRDSERLWSANRSKQADCGIVCISWLKPSGVGDICENPLGSKDDYYTDRPLHTPSCSFRVLVTPVSMPPGLKKPQVGAGVTHSDTCKHTPAIVPSAVKTGALIACYYRSPQAFGLLLPQLLHSKWQV